MNDMRVRVREGELEGMPSRDGSCRLFRGVPYAEPPVGELRFRRPQPKKPWVGVRCAKSFPPRAFQGDMSRDPFYGKEFYSGDLPPMSEDCLYLNIWAPRAGDGEKLPVLFWIHGGAFLHGFSCESEFDGEGFARKGVILVTVNYRVGALGFFTHESLDRENPEGLSGNYGIFDQIAALSWVRENIGSFGGDPERITVAGQSAGCMSVQCLVSSRLTEGLIHGAILQSGGGIPGFATDYKKSDVLYASRRLMELLKAESIEELRALPAESIALGAYQVMGRDLCWLPHVDGYLLEDTVQALAESGRVHPIPYLIGSAKDEMGATAEHHLLRESAVRFALALEGRGLGPVYVYQFDRELPGDDAKAFHSCELWYEFETMDRCWRPFEPRDFALSREFSGSFAQFVRTGSPEGEGLPSWKPYTSSNPAPRVFE